MTIFEDVGQKIGQHDNIKDFCAANGITIRRQKLNCGDYQFPPTITVDTKKGMAEIYSDIVSDHDRFRSECIRAQEDGTRLVILIEDEKISSLEEAKSWDDPRMKDYMRKYGFIIEAQKHGKMLEAKIPRPPVSSERLVGMMNAMTMRYGVEWAFCRPGKTGETIVEILSKAR